MGVVQRAPGQDGALRDLATNLQHLGEDGRQVDRQLLALGVEPEVELLDVGNGSRIGYAPISQQAAYDVDALPYSLYWLGEDQPVLRLYLHLVAGPQAQDEAPL